jgi:hypothetical protein
MTASATYDRVPILVASQFHISVSQPSEYRLLGTDLVTLSAAKHSVFVCVVVSENRINTPFPFGIVETFNKASTKQNKY